MAKENAQESTLKMVLTLVSEKAPEIPMPEILKIYAHVPTHANHREGSYLIYSPRQRDVLHLEPITLEMENYGDRCDVTMTIPSPAAINDSYCKIPLTVSEIGWWDAVEMDVIIGKYTGQVTAYVSSFKFCQKMNLVECVITKTEGEGFPIKVNLFESVNKPYCEPEPVGEKRELLSVDALKPLHHYHNIHHMFGYILWKIREGDSRTINEIAEEWRDDHESDIDEDICITDGLACNKKILERASCEHPSNPKYIGWEAYHNQICSDCYKYIAKEINSDTVAELCGSVLPYFTACIKKMHGIYDNETIATVMEIFAAVQVAPGIVAAVCGEYKESDVDKIQLNKKNKCASNACEAAYMED